MSRFPVLLAVVLLAACYVEPPTLAPKARAPTAVRASFDRTWRAAIDVVSEQVPDVGRTDRASGIIAGVGPLATTDADTSAADCGRAAGSARPPTSMKYNVVVRGDSDGATVKVNAFWRNLGDFCVSRGMWEVALEHAIRDRAEARP